MSRNNRHNNYGKVVKRFNPDFKQVKTATEKSVVVKPESNVGKVYRGVTKYIDVENKKERNYVVVSEKNNNVVVAKLKSIKKFDENDKNADKALVEINYKRYGLEKRTGVDFERFAYNRMSSNKLSLDDRDAFPYDCCEFTLSNRDRDKAIYHTGVKKRNKQKKGN